MRNEGEDITLSESSDPATLNHSYFVFYIETEDP